MNDPSLTWCIVYGFRWRDLCLLINPLVSSRFFLSLRCWLVHVKWDYCDIYVLCIFKSGVLKVCLFRLACATYSRIQLKRRRWRDIYSDVLLLIWTNNHSAFWRWFIKSYIIIICKLHIVYHLLNVICAHHKKRADENISFSVFYFIVCRTQVTTILLLDYTSSTKFDL